MSNFDLVLRLFLQLTVILAVCRVVGWLGTRYFGQTQVVSEMIAGVLLGPSLLGWLAPEMQHWLFPMKATVGGVEITHPSMSILYVLAQLGLVLYMFIVGLEFNPEHIRGRARSAGLISGAGIIVPFALGAMLALMLRDDAELFQPGLSAWGAALFMGASMSITAFPMLARILYEKDITNTRLGVVTLAAGSIDDAIAWCLLAVVLASFKSSPQIAVLAIGGGIAYGVFMVVVGRGWLRGFERSYMRRTNAAEEPSVGLFTLLMMVVMLCAWFTDYIGIYAVFGAFILGACMPKGAFARLVIAKSEMITTSLLLPVFFVYSGLNTQLGLVNTPGLWMLTAVIIVAAIGGKGVACMLAARVSGESWRNAAVVGTLMNARGLMELIILNIGLEKNLITPMLFAMMVMMAVVTTLMASPLFQFLFRADEVDRTA
ncbi:MAG: cation:proton antiporter [Thermoanaerobaculia bacterium]